MRIGCVLGAAVLQLLIAGGLRAMQQLPESCDQYEVAIHADSTNAKAWFKLGECRYLDYEMIAPGDSARLAFRSSWTTALRALHRAVALDPRLEPAYRTLFAMLFSETRDGCSSVTLMCTHVAPNMRVGDSVVTIPRPVPVRSPDPYGPVLREAQASRVVNMTEARDAAAKWASVAPDDWRPHEYLGRSLVRLGDRAAGIAELERAAALGTIDVRRELFWDRFEALVKADRGTDARRLLAETANDTGRDTTRLTGVVLASLSALLGHREELPPDTTARARAMRARMDSVVRTLNVPRTPSPEGQFRLTFTAGDLPAARKALVRFDSIVAPKGQIRLPAVNEAFLQSAEWHLLLGDSAFAERRLDEIERALMDRTFEHNSVVRGGGPQPWLGRAWVLAGNLAAARGRHDEAARMYRRVVGLWADADAPLQPIVEEARAKLAALSMR